MNAKKRNAPFYSFFGEAEELHSPCEPYRIGVLPGEGVGPEVTQAALTVLSTVSRVCDLKIEIAAGPTSQTDVQNHASLSPSLIDFCSNIFQKKGAILCGPRGGRFVYQLRKEFDLFCKILPVKPFRVFHKAKSLSSKRLQKVDFLVVRENVAGIYQGTWNEGWDADGRRFAEHSFSYNERDILRIVDVAARLAANRRGMLVVVIKDDGIPSISRLWRDCAISATNRRSLDCTFMNVDYAAYCLVRHPNTLDVVVTSNLFGDIFGDIAAIHYGTRALSFSGNYNEAGACVYQTGHGAAFDISGLDIANPVGQILALAMMLKESFGLVYESQLIRRAVAHVWDQGFRTADMTKRGCKTIGTAEMGNRIAEAAVSLSVAESNRIP